MGVSLSYWFQFLSVDLEQVWFCFLCKDQLANGNLPNWNICIIIHRWLLVCAPEINISMWLRHRTIRSLRTFRPYLHGLKMIIKWGINLMIVEEEVFLRTLQVQLNAKQRYRYNNRPNCTCRGRRQCQSTCLYQTSSKLEFKYFTGKRWSESRRLY